MEKDTLKAVTETLMSQSIRVKDVQILMGLLSIIAIVYF